MNLALGTAQLRSNYGVSSTNKKAGDDEVRKILDTALASGIKFIDTAVLFDDVEETLGRVMRPDNPFKIISKTIHFKNGIITKEDPQTLLRDTNVSLSKLKRDSIHTLLIHDANDLLKENGNLLYDALLELKSSGKVENIGVSAYDKGQIELLMEKYDLDIIQLPVNVLDQRLLVNGFLARIKEKGISIFARSVFLQGLLLMDLDEIPVYFEDLKGDIRTYFQELEDKSVTKLAGAISFARSIAEIDQIVLGINDHEELLECINSFKSEVDLDYSRFASHQYKLLDPRQWKLPQKN
ncbi:MAG: aldo/keto reductase [Bacteroidetes bacterium]|nr:aldo/keto reductase [Bacteroidota bacterium]